MFWRILWLYHIISAWGLELLVLTRWAIPRASKRGASNGYSLHAFFYYGKHITLITNRPNLESIGFYIPYDTLVIQNQYNFCQVF